MVGPSAAALYTLTGTSEELPALLIDEVGGALARKDNSDFLGVIESGFQEGKPVPKVAVVDGKRIVERFRVYSPMVLSGIDTNIVPDTIESS
jgi:hypothetical protein